MATACFSAWYSGLACSTPPEGHAQWSWRLLADKVVELEFSALARLCLHRRIPTIEKLTHEILALAAERNAKAIKINWQFTIPAARSKLNSHYCAVQPENKKFKR